MALSREEKGILQEALSVYLQVIARQVPPQQMQQVAAVAEGIMRKLDNLDAGGGKGGNRPQGISDEWYNNVCKTCDNLTATGCADKVTAKFPGKCDPILHYERTKAGKQQ